MVPDSVRILLLFDTFSLNWHFQPIRDLKRQLFIQKPAPSTAAAPFLHYLR